MLNGAKATKQLLNELDSAHNLQSNADRIRSMTDEELAANLLRMLDGDVYCTNRPECGAMLDTDDGIPDEWCAQCLLNWLRKPVEEATT